ncbi:uncharacterized protein LOC131166664 [Malania oleifera]|uniref:uncharacterized protein LOC131166664 n=1 Tax=Malania oleifera TaxID=397392 RepID=UPI0025AE5996|nr:uncharacterized protein LOC131166664 [Malania oleifera]
MRSSNQCLKVLVFIILAISVFYLFCAQTQSKFFFSSHPCSKKSSNVHETLRSSSSSPAQATTIFGSTQNQTDAVTNPEIPGKTQLRHIVFGIGASAKLWDHRKEYIKQWWRPGEMRGAVWLDRPVDDAGDDGYLPELRISGDISEFKYTNKHGHRSGIRLTRIVSEMVRLGMEDVRWFVMGDDDTVFVVDNVVRVLAKYDHREMYYIGSSSESHLQNIEFSYGMAYGGGGFAISYALAVALEKMQDRCIQRYPELYGSDDRIQACMAELGVPLTKEIGFHQCDLYGNLFGLLAAHPVAPLVSLHHLDLVEPIFPDMDRVDALQRLSLPIGLDSAGLMQQSICYDPTRSWTVSVSWGYAVQIIRGILTPREMERPSRTFLNWYPKADPTGFAFNTRPVRKNPCQAPFVYFLSDALFDDRMPSQYLRHGAPAAHCGWKMPSPSRIHIVEVYKKPDPDVWDKSPRRNCCRVLPTNKNGTMVIEVGACREGETIQPL